MRRASAVNDISIMALDADTLASSEFPVQFHWALSSIETSIGSLVSALRTASRKESALASGLAPHIGFNSAALDRLRIRFSENSSTAGATDPMMTRLALGPGTAPHPRTLHCRPSPLPWARLRAQSRLRW